MKTERLQLRIEPVLKEQAAKIAEKRGSSLSVMVTKFLQDMVDHEQEALRDENGVRQI